MYDKPDNFYSSDNLGNNETIISFIDPYPDQLDDFQFQPPQNLQALLSSALVIDDAISNDSSHNELALNDDTVIEMGDDYPLQMINVLPIENLSQSAEAQAADQRMVDGFLNIGEQQKQEIVDASSPTSLPATPNTVLFIPISSDVYDEDEDEVMPQDLNIDLPDDVHHDGNFDSDMVYVMDRPAVIPSPTSFHPDQAVMQTLTYSWMAQRPTRGNGLFQQAEVSSSLGKRPVTLDKLSEQGAEQEYVKFMSAYRDKLLKLHDELAKNNSLFKNFSGVIKNILHSDEQARITTDAGRLVPNNRSHAKEHNIKLLELVLLHKYLSENKIASGVALKQMPIQEMVAWAIAVPIDRLSGIIDDAWKSSRKGTICETSIRKEVAKPIAELLDVHKQVQQFNQNKAQDFPPLGAQQTFGVMHNFIDDLNIRNVKRHKQ